MWLLAACCSPSPAQPAAAPAPDAFHAAEMQRVPRAELVAMLQQYDREIATLRATESEGTGPAIEASVVANAAAVRHSAVRAVNGVSALASTRASEFAAREKAGLDALSAAKEGPQSPWQLSAAIDREYRRQSSRLSASASSDLAAYRGELERQTGAQARAFAAAMAQRTQRAVQARAAQLYEKESTLAFDLDRQDAGARVNLALKLNTLHLDRAGRAALQSRLEALDGAEARKIDAMRSSDAVVLAQYRAEMLAKEAAGVASMRGRLAQAAASNFTQRQRVFAAQTSGLSLPLLAPVENPAPAVANAQQAAFRGGYDLPAQADAIETAFGNAASALPARFERLGAADRQSRMAIDAEIAALQAQRDALARVIASRASV